MGVARARAAKTIAASRARARVAARVVRASQCHKARAKACQTSHQTPTRGLARFLLDHHLSQWHLLLLRLSHKSLLHLLLSQIWHSSWLRPLLSSRSRSSERSSTPSSKSTQPCLPSKLARSPVCSSIWTCRSSSTCTRHLMPFTRRSLKPSMCWLTTAWPTLSTQLLASRSHQLRPQPRSKQLLQTTKAKEKDTKKY